MQLLLIEGQPGSGKTTFVEKICGSLADKSTKFVLNDEYRQDSAIFTDIWEDNYDFSLWNLQKLSRTGGLLC